MDFVNWIDSNLAEAVIILLAGVALAVFSGEGDQELRSYKDQKKQGD